MWIFLGFIVIVIYFMFKVKKPTQGYQSQQSYRSHHAGNLETELEKSVKVTNDLFPSSKAKELSQEIQKTSYQLLKNSIERYFSAYDQMKKAKHLGLSLIAVAHNAGIRTWEIYGDELTRERCIEVANAALNLEVFAQAENIKEDEFLYEFYTRAIAEKAMYTQCATIVTNLYLGYEEKARKLSTTSRFATTAIDPDIAQAEIQESICSLDHITIPNSNEYVRTKP